MLAVEKGQISGEHKENNGSALRAEYIRAHEVVRICGAWMGLSAEKYSQKQ